MRDAMTTCFEIREKVPLHVGGDLEPEAMQVVHAHLAECAACAREAVAAEQARDAFRSALRAPEGLATPSLWSRVQAGIVAERAAEAAARAGAAVAAGPATPGRTGPARRRVLRLVGGIAAMAAAVALAFSIDFGSGGSISVDPGPVAQEGGRRGPHSGEVGLRRVDPGEKTLFEQATPYELVRYPTPSGTNSLAGYRTAPRRLR
jgi:hypothetical protein